MYIPGAVKAEEGYDTASETASETSSETSAETACETPSERASGTSSKTASETAFKIVSETASETVSETAALVPVVTRVLRGEGEKMAIDTTVVTSSVTSLYSQGRPRLELWGQGVST